MPTGQKKTRGMVKQLSKKNKNSETCTMKEKMGGGGGGGGGEEGVYVHPKHSDLPYEHLNQSK